MLLREAPKMKHGQIALNIEITFERLNVFELSWTTTIRKIKLAYIKVYPTYDRTFDRPSLPEQPENEKSNPILKYTSL